MQSATLPPLREGFSTLSEQVYGAILGAIIERRVEPGERLMLDDLAQQLRVSRTPVRDALSRLAAEGLVEPTGRRGFRVTAPTAADLIALYDMRLMCELYAAEKGIGNVTPAFLVRLEELANDCARLARSADPTDRLVLSLRDRKLHNGIISLGQNPKLSELYERLNIHMHSLRASASHAATGGVEELYVAEHAAIIAALRDGDVAAAKQSIRLHILNAQARTLAALAMDEAVRSLSCQPPGDKRKVAGDG